MPSQKDMETSTSIQPATPAPQPTPTTNAAPAVVATTSNSSLSPAPKPTKAESFREECIVLVLSPRGTVHPMIDPKAPAGVKVYSDADMATAAVMESKLVNSLPFAVIPLKGLF